MKNDQENKQENQNEKAIPKEGKQGLKEQAINKKGNISDGKEINHQVEQKRENHQARDNA